MFDCRDLGRVICLGLAGLALVGPVALGACTKSHDIEVSEQPLSAGSSAAESGAKAQAGSSMVSVGSAGRAAGAGTTGAAGKTGAAGTTGGAGRTGAAGAAPVAGSGAATLACGKCAAANLLGIVMAPACCTTDNKCGLDLTSLGTAMCIEQNAAGTLDASCPAQMTSGVMLQGCCRANGVCGGMDTYLGLGCTLASSGQTIACKAP